MSDPFARRRTHRHRRMAVMVVGALVLGLPLAATLAYNVRVTHIDGEPVYAEAERIDDGTLRLTNRRNPEHPAALQLDGIEEIEYFERTDEVEVPARYNLTLHLVSGDRLIGRVLSGSATGFLFESMSFGRLPIDTEHVARIDVRPNQVRRPFQRNPDVERSMQLAQADALYLNPAPEAESADAAIGFLDMLTADGIEFYDQNDIIAGLVRWSEVLAVTRFAQTIPQPEAFQAIVLARNGEQVTAEVLGLRDDVYRLRSHVLRPVTEDEAADEPGEHARGLVLRAHAGDLVKLTFRYGKFAYLSDMNPVRVEEFPYFGGPGAAPGAREEYWWRYRRDRAVDGSELALRGEDMRIARYSKGLGVHSYSKLSYRLGGDFSRFMADIGLDTSAGEQGSVVFRVFVDNEREPRFESDVMRHTAPLRSISVDVSGAQVIHLEVDFADNGDIQDRANWAQARAIR